VRYSFSDFSAVQCLAYDRRRDSATFRPKLRAISHHGAAARRSRIPSKRRKSNDSVRGTRAALPWRIRCVARLEGFGKEDGMNTSRVKVIGIGLGLYLLGFGMLAGATVERMRFDHKRSQMLARYERAIRQWHAFRIELEKPVARP